MLLIIFGAGIHGGDSKVLGWKELLAQKVTDFVFHVCLLGASSLDPSLCNMAVDIILQKSG